MANPPDNTNPLSTPKLEDLLASVLELAGPAQDRALDEVCASHPDLATELRATFAALQRFGLATDGVESVVAFAREPAPGQHFGPFQIVRKLGRGGMGIVYLAEDTELNRRIALKLIRPEFLDSDRAHERFRREVAAAAKLDHVGICTVHGTGEIDGQPYLVMRYIEGQSLDEQLVAARAADRLVWSSRSSSGNADGSGSSGRLRSIDLRPALELAEALANAVQVAHEQRLVHRDIKPANVMVMPDGQPVLMDFGLARDAAANAVHLTQSSDLIGTPAYMAPEQVRSGLTDARTDVHALGALLYECLTLRLPYVGRNREELYRNILDQTPIDVRRLQPAASRDLATVVHKALAKEPHRRYASAGALAQDLRAVLDGQPTVARPPGPLQRGWMQIQRNRATSAVALAVVLGLVASLFFLGRSIDSGRRSSAIAKIQEAREVQPEDPWAALRILREALTISPEPQVVAAIHGLLPELQNWDLVLDRPDRQFHAIETSPDGRFVLVTGSDQLADLYRADGSRWASLPAPSRAGFAFSSERSLWIVAPGSPRRIQHYDLSGAQPRATGTALVVPDYHLTSVALDESHNRALVTGRHVDNGTGGAWLFEASTGTIIRALPVADGTQSGGFLENGDIVLPGALLDPDGNQRRPLAPGSGKWQRVHAAGDRFAVATNRGLQVFDAAGERLNGKERDAHVAEALARCEWSADGQRLVASFRDGWLWLLDRDGVLLQSWNAGRNANAIARFMPDGRRVLTSDSRGRVCIWDSAGNLQARLLGHNNMHAVALRGTRDVVLAAGWDGRVRRWRADQPVPGLPFLRGLRNASATRTGTGVVVIAEDGRLLELRPGGAVLEAAERLPRGHYYVWPHLDGRSTWIVGLGSALLWRWTPTEGLSKSTAIEHPRQAFQVAHLASGRLLCASGYNVRLGWCEPDSGTCGVYDGLLAAGVGVTRDGRRAVVSGNRTLTLLDGQGVPLWPEPKHDPTGGLSSVVAVADDGSRAVVGRGDGSATVWDLRTGSIETPLKDHTDVLMWLAISPNSEIFATATRGGHLVVRRFDQSEPLLNWRSNGEERMQGIAFLDDHTLITTGSKLGQLRYWWWEHDRLENVLAGIRWPKGR